MLNNLTVPSPTISGGRMETWVTGSSPATQSQTRIRRHKRTGEHTVGHNRILEGQILEGGGGGSDP